MLDCFLTKLTLPSVQRFGRLDQSASRVLSSRKSSTGHSWRPGAASFLGARSSITSSSCVWMPHSLRGAVSLTPTLSLLLFMIIGLPLSATLISMQRKSSRFQMFCLHSRKAFSQETWTLVQERFGGSSAHSVDLTALPSNVQSHSSGTPIPFFSPFLVPGSAGVKLFAQLPHRLPILFTNLYVFPPIVLIPEVL